MLDMLDKQCPGPSWNYRELATLPTVGESLVMSGT